MELSTFFCCLYLLNKFAASLKELNQLNVFASFHLLVIFCHKNLSELWATIKSCTQVVFTWSRFAGMKFQPVEPGQILPYDYMRKLNFVLARRDSFPTGICLDLYAFLWIFLCKPASLQNWKSIDFDRL